MRILVIAKGLTDQQSARQTLSEHELTIATNCREGMNVLYCPGMTTTYVQDGFKLSFDPKKKLQKFDVVLSDLYLPVSDGQAQRGCKEFRDINHTIGWGFVLRAVLNGVRFAAAVSVESDFHNPVEEAMYLIGSRDLPGPWEKAKPWFKINKSRVGFYMAPTRLVLDALPCKAKHKKGNECGYCHGTNLDLGKDWGYVLNLLLGKPGLAPKV